MACNYCRHAHKGCNRAGPPCGRCFETGLEGCEYSTSSAFTSHNEASKTQRTTRSASDAVKLNKRGRKPKKEKKDKKPKDNNNNNFIDNRHSVHLHPGENAAYSISVMESAIYPFTETSSLKVLNEETEEKVLNLVEENAENVFPPLEPIKVNREALPKAVYKEISDIDDELRILLHDKQLYWDRPSSYFVYQEKTQEDEDNQVEYDIDSEDEGWLSDFNKDKKRSGHPLTEDDFEFMIDRLEKEAFKHESLQAPFADDIDVENTSCSICNDGTSDDTNQIVFCDGCDIGVHQECYGIRYIPEGLWFCAKCDAKDKDIKCTLCPFSGGAFKKMADGKWVHVICALWIPEAKIKHMDDGYLYEIESLADIPKQRWKLVCEICRRQEGACIQCKERSCAAAFHVTCAQQSGLSMETQDDSRRRAACTKHSPKRKNETLMYDATGTPIKMKKKKGFDPTTPSKKKKFLDLFSHETISLQQAEKALSKRAPSSIIQAVWEYWIQKRKSRSGNPLLKRFAKNIIFSPRSLIQKKGDNQPAQEAYFKMYDLRKDLEKSRIILELVKKREKLKLQYAKTIDSIFELETNPTKPTLRSFLSYFEGEDKFGYFRDDVPVELFPDYPAKIKHPMSFHRLHHKLENEVMTLSDFWNCLFLIYNNAISYNDPSTPVYKEAKRLLKILEAVKERVESEVSAETLRKIVVRGKSIEQPKEVKEVKEVVLSPRKTKKQKIEEEQKDMEFMQMVKQELDAPTTKKAPKVEVIEPELESETETNPLLDDLANILVRLEKADKQLIFLEIVTDDVVPGYSKVVKHPMAFRTMESKVTNGLYSSMKDFKDDFRLMVENAKIFNPVDSIYFREACRLCWIGEKLISRIENGTLHKDSIELQTCSVCNSDKNGEKLLLCDACDEGFHTYCLNPPLRKIPQGDWYCSECDNSKHCNICAVADSKGFNCYGCDKRFHLQCMGLTTTPREYYCKECKGYEGINEDVECEICSKDVDPGKLLLCDRCDKGYHLYCLDPPLDSIPDDEQWFCQGCQGLEGSGIKRRMSFTARRRKGLSDSATGE